MMVFTHVLVGVMLGGVLSVLTPADPFGLVVAGGVGGFFPDIDMLLVHRKTTHFPIIYTGIAILIGSVYLLLGDPAVLVAAVGVSAAALHSLGDTLGGGKEMRPWRETDDRAVFNHVTGRWITPRRLFYDGSAPDLLVAISSGIVALLALPSNFGSFVAIVVALSVVYTAIRRTITRWIPEQYPTFSGYIQATFNMADETNTGDTETDRP